MTLAEIKAQAAEGLRQAEQLKQQLAAKGNKAASDAGAWAQEKAAQATVETGRIKKRVDKSVAQTAASARSAGRAVEKGVRQGIDRGVQGAQQAGRDISAGIDRAAASIDRYAEDHAEFLKSAGLSERGSAPFGYRTIVPQAKAGPWAEHVTDDRTSELLALEGIYKPIPGERYVMGAGLMRGHRVPESLGRAYGLYRDPETRRLVHVAGGDLTIPDRMEAARQSELVRRQAIIAERAADRAQWSKDDQQLMAWIRGRVDGAAADTFPWIAGGIRTVALGGQLSDNIGGERWVIARDEAEYPRMRFAGKVVGGGRWSC